MVEIKAKLKIPRGAYRLEVKGQLKLAFDARQKSRLRTHLDSGEEVALMLPRGDILRGGDLVVASDGRVIEVVAETEKVLHVTCKTPEDITRAAYRLGNRHVPVQVGDGFLRIAADHVLEEMLQGWARQWRRCRHPSSRRPGPMAAVTGTTMTSRVTPGAFINTAPRTTSAARSRARSRPSARCDDHRARPRPCTVRHDHNHARTSTSDGSRAVCCSSQVLRFR